MKVEFEVPRVHPSLNVWVNWHWGKRRNERDIWDLLIKNVWREALKVKFKGMVKVSICYYVKSDRVRDYDNWTPKFIMDALKKTFIIDDNMRVVKAPKWEFVCGAKESKTIVSISGKIEND